MLDSPELARDLNKVAAGLHELYELPFRVAILSRNGGFSLANNLGASVARGRTLLLLNSDVLPLRPHWISRMSAFYDATPNIGALGAKLLYEEDSLQHAGMYFALESESLLWGNQHYLKGFARNFAPANVARPVPAVTGACMMIDRALYEEVGGLDHSFVQGGYEDSDLCLRLIELGRQNWYLPQAELYHLEQQSFPTADEYRWLATRYNTWLQTHRWRGLIEELMTAQDTERRAPAALAGLVAGEHSEQSNQPAGGGSALKDTTVRPGLESPCGGRSGCGRGTSTCRSVRASARETSWRRRRRVHRARSTTRRTASAGCWGACIRTGSRAAACSTAPATAELTCSWQRSWAPASASASTCASTGSSRLASCFATGRAPPTASASRSATSTTFPSWGWSASTSCCSGASSITCPIRSRACGWPPTWPAN